MNHEINSFQINSILKCLKHALMIMFTCEILKELKNSYNLQQHLSFFFDLLVFVQPSHLLLRTINPN